MLWLKLLHVVAVGLFAGAQLAMLALQSLLWRATDEAERKSLARASAAAGRALLMPVMYLAFLSGVLYWAVVFAFKGPPYIHVMLLCGFLAVGMAQMWKARARKLAEALDKGTPFAEAKAHLEKGWLFLALALGLTFVAYLVAVLKVPMGGG